MTAVDGQTQDHLLSVVATKHVAYEKHRRSTSGLILNRSVRRAPFSRYTQENQEFSQKE
jgi:hypothetical protein